MDFIFKQKLQHSSGEGPLQLAIHHLDDSSRDHPLGLKPHLPVTLALPAAPEVQRGHAIAGLPAGPPIDLALFLGRPLRGPHWDVVRPGLAISVDASRIRASPRIDVLGIVLRIVAATTMGALVASLFAGEVGVPLGLGVIGLPGLVLGVAAAAALVDGDTGVFCEESIRLNCTLVRI